MASAVDDEEFTIVTIDEAFAFKIPPQSSASGHKAEDWKTQVWSGSLRVVSKGPHCAIKLVSPDGRLFAVCPVKEPGPPSVEKVTDSSRYFVLRIEDGRGKHAFIGIGFQQRSEAFDFNVGLQDHFKELEREKLATVADDTPGADFSLKSGETIRLSVPSAKARKRAEPTGSAAASGGASGLLAPPPTPPPAGTGRRRRPRATKETSLPDSSTAWASGSAPAATASGSAAVEDLSGLNFGSVVPTAAETAGLVPSATAGTQRKEPTEQWNPF